MYYGPCVHCHQKSTCERLLNIKTAAKELGLTSIRVKCAVPFEPFQPGMRVLVHSAWWSMPIKGTVSCRATNKRDKIVVWLDESPLFEEGGAISRYRAFPEELELLDCPSVKVCPECGRPDGYKNDPEWVCNTC